MAMANSTGRVATSTRATSKTTSGRAMVRCIGWMALSIEGTGWRVCRMASGL
jgi:hypothetical protein